MIQREQLEAANHAKTEFIENMRHDIRGPLSSIVGLSEILENSELDHEKIRVYAGHLRNSSEALLSFLNKILESINIATGDIPLLKNRFILYELLESVINLHRAIAAEKNLEMNFYFDESIPKYLIGDPLRIYRILLELLVNALKFTHQGHVNIYAQLNRKDKNTGLHVIKIIIEDTGIGIAKDKQQELFVRFKRLTPSYQGIYKGAGLGLSIAKQLLDDLQAEIYLESALNEGARFTCVFELREALLNETLDASFDESHAVLKHSEVVALTTPPELPVQAALRVLVVEDNSIAAMVARTILEDVGCSVDLAIDGTSAVALSNNKDYHLIFMDIGLPDFDGYEATSQIRAIETQKATIAGGSRRAFIVGLTAHAEPDKKQRGLDVGMNVVLTKPLSRDKAITLFEMSVGRTAIVS